MTRIYLSLGSNIDARSNIRQGLDLLREQYSLLRCSPIVESEPVGFQGDPFINLIAIIETEQEITALRRALRQIEFDFGREPQAAKFSGRTLDIDIVMIDQLHGQHFGLQLPRPDLFTCAYMLWPLSLLEPDQIPPGQPLTAQQLWQRFTDHSQKLWLTEL